MALDAFSAGTQPASSAVRPIPTVTQSTTRARTHDAASSGFAAGSLLAYIAFTEQPMNAERFDAIVGSPPGYKKTTFFSKHM